MSGFITYEDRLKDELQDFRASMKLAVKALKFYANRGNYIELIQKSIEEFEGLIRGNQAFIV